jgi:hypothetical protein
MYLIIFLYFYRTPLLKISSSKKGRRARERKGKPFKLCHCWGDLKNDENSKNHEIYLVPKKIPKSSVGYESILDGDDDHEASSDEGKKEGPLPTRLLKPRHPREESMPRSRVRRTEKVTSKCYWRPW